jgi:hypothetical protein
MLQIGAPDAVKSDPVTAPTKPSRVASSTSASSVREQTADAIDGTSVPEANRVLLVIATRRRDKTLFVIGRAFLAAHFARRSFTISNGSPSGSQSAAVHMEQAGPEGAARATSAEALKSTFWGTAPAVGTQKPKRLAKKMEKNPLLVRRR